MRRNPFRLGLGAGPAAVLPPERPTSMFSRFFSGPGLQIVQQICIGEPTVASPVKAPGGALIPRPSNKAIRRHQAHPSITGVSG